MDERRVERSHGHSAFAVANVDPAPERIPVADGPIELILVRRERNAVDIRPERGRPEIEWKGDEDGLDSGLVLLIECPIDGKRFLTALERVDALTAHDAGTLNVNGNRDFALGDDRVVDGYIF